MKKLRLLTLSLALLSGTILYSNSIKNTNFSNQHLISTQISELPSPESEVWVCRGKYAEKYHIKGDCRGLNNCRAEIEKISISEAAQDDYCSPCGWCSKYKPSLCR